MNLVLGPKGLPSSLIKRSTYQANCQENNFSTARDSDTGTELTPSLAQKLTPKSTLEWSERGSKIIQKRIQNDVDLEVSGRSQIDPKRDPIWRPTSAKM